MAKKKNKFLTVPLYAAHRGKDPGAVRYAIREGKLSSSIDRSSGKILIDWKKADQEWIPRTEATDELITPEPPKKNKSKKESAPSSKKKEWDPDNPYDTSMLVPTIVSKMRREAYETELARIKVEKEMGLLVVAKDVELMWVKLGTITKTKVLGIPSKFKQRVPELTDSQYKVLEMIVAEALEEISREQVDSEED